MAKRVKRTDNDRLRTLASIAGKGKPYTQKEMAAALGVSTRTLRRIQNVQGYVPSDRLLKRIHRDLVREETQVRRHVTKKYGIPSTPVLSLPREFVSKSGTSRTLAFNAGAWTNAQKEQFLTAAARSGQYDAWRIRVRVPVGVATSGVDGEINEGDSAIHYMRGPIPFPKLGGRMDFFRDELDYHGDAGRVVVEIFLIESLKRKRRQ